MYWRYTLNFRLSNTLLDWKKEYRESDIARLESTAEQLGSKKEHVACIRRSGNLDTK